MLVHNVQRSFDADGCLLDVHIAHTLMVSLPGDLWRGGADAERQLAGMVAAALAPHRKPGAPDTALDTCFTLHRCRSGAFVLRSF